MAQISTQVRERLSGACVEFWAILNFLIFASFLAAVSKFQPENVVVKTPSIPMLFTPILREIALLVTFTFYSADENTITRYFYFLLGNFQELLE